MSQDVQNRPFDLAKLDFEVIRKRRCKQLLRIALPIVAILLLVASKLLTPALFTHQAVLGISSQQYSAALKWLAPLKIINVIEPYKAYYNSGIAYYGQQQYTDAEQSFRRALEKSNGENECKIRINLILSIEKDADQLRANNDIDGAIVRYDGAKAVLLDSQAPCNIDIQTGETKNHEESADAEQQAQVYDANQRIVTKSDDLKLERNNDTSSETAGATSEDEGLPDDAQLQELADQAREQATMQAESLRRSRYLDSQAQSGSQYSYVRIFW